MVGTDAVKQVKGHTHNQWIATVIANTVLFTFGLQNGWMSPTVHHLQSPSSPTGSPVSDEAISWIASTMCIGAVIAVPFITYIIEKFGRKIGIIFISISQTICWILKASTGSVAGLIAARIFCGMGASSCFIVAGVYIKEVSQENIRGVLGATITVSFNLGILVMYAIGGYTDYYTTILVVCWMPIATILMTLKIPESPAFLVNQRENEKALSSLAWLRGRPENDDVLLNELKAFKAEASTKAGSTLSFLTIMKNPPWRRGFIVIMVIMFVQGWSGNLVVTTFALPLLELAEVTFSPRLQSLSFPIVMIVGGLTSLVSVEKVGRKPLMAMSLLVSSISLFGLAACFVLTEQGTSTPKWIPVLSLAMYMLAFSLGLLPLPSVIMTEMFNLQIRTKLVGYIVMFTWFMSFLQMNIYSATNTDGASTPFFIFATINLCGVFVVLTFLPETRAKTSEEIDRLIMKRTLC